MGNPTDEVPNPSNDAGTPVEAADRTTGQGESQDTREGAEPEAPGNKDDVPGSPNQGTEAR